MKYFSEISLQDSKFRVDFDENNGFWDTKFDKKGRILIRTASK